MLYAGATCNLNGQSYQEVKETSRMSLDENDNLIVNSLHVFPIKFPIQFPMHEIHFTIVCLCRNQRSHLPHAWWHCLFFTYLQVAPKSGYYGHMCLQ